MNINPFDENNYRAIEKEEQQKNIASTKENKTIFNNEYEFNLLETSYELHASKDKLNEFTVKAEIGLLNTLLSIFNIQSLSNLLERVISSIANSSFLENKLIGKFLGKSKFRRFFMKLLLLFNFKLLLMMFSIMLALNKFRFLLQAQIKNIIQKYNPTNLKEENVLELQKRKKLPSHNFELSEKKEKNLDRSIDFNYNQNESIFSIAQNGEFKIIEFSSSLTKENLSPSFNSPFKSLSLEDSASKKDFLYISRKYNIDSGASVSYNLDMSKFIKYVWNMMKEGVKLLTEVEKFTERISQPDRQKDWEVENGRDRNKGFVKGDGIEGLGDNRKRQ